MRSFSTARYASNLRVFAAIQLSGVMPFAASVYLPSPPTISGIAFSTGGIGTKGFRWAFACAAAAAASFLPSAADFACCFFSSLMSSGLPPPTYSSMAMRSR